MTLDEYNQRMTQINKEFEIISQRTLNQALLGVADTSNEMFVELMQRHAHLTKLSSEITEGMIAMMKKSQ